MNLIFLVNQLNTLSIKLNNIHGLETKAIINKKYSYNKQAVIKLTMFGVRLQDSKQKSTSTRKSTSSSLYKPCRIKKKKVSADKPPDF